jgi:hypothetical protein
MNTDLDIASLSNLLDTDEPLHEDLQRHLSSGEEIGLGWQFLRHPLLYEFPYIPKANAFYNRKYLYKTEKTEDALSHERWKEYILLHERPWRFEALKTCLYEGLADDKLGAEVWPLIAMTWVDSENIHQNLEEWEDVWLQPFPNRLENVMEKYEQKAFAKFPDEIKIFRGVRHLTHARGLSWTTNRKRGVRFAHGFPRDGLKSFLVTATVKKENVLAYFLRRNENEIVVHPDHVTIKNIAELKAK